MALLLTCLAVEHTVEDVLAGVDFDIETEPVYPVNPITANNGGYTFSANVDPSKLLVSSSGYIQANWYADAKSIETRIREALKYLLGTIKVVNGYRRDLNTVFDMIPADTMQQGPLPAAVIYVGRKPVTQRSNLDSVIDAPWFVEVTAGTDDPQVTEDLAADIKTMIGNNWMLPGEDGVETCHLCVYDSDLQYNRRVFGQEQSVQLGFRVRYTELHADASVN